MLLSFCTFVKNRREQLEETLPKSLGTVEKMGVEAEGCAPLKAEFCILDWGSEDGLEPCAHPLVRWKSAGPQKFVYTPKCKNLAHAMSKGEYLCNLDADNWVSEKWLAEVLPQLRPDVVIHSLGSGCWGRVLLHRDLFAKLGGYDEGMIGWGYQDVDLVKRAEMLGARQVFVDNRDFIPHEDALRTRVHGTRYGNKERTDRINAARSRKRISQGLYDWRVAG